MPDFHFVAQFPINEVSVPMEQLRAEAADEARSMVVGLGFTVAGQWVFEVLDLPLAMHLQCTAPVQPLKFPGDK